MFPSSFKIPWHSSAMRLKVYAHIQKQIYCDFSYCQVDKQKPANEKTTSRKIFLKLTISSFHKKEWVFGDLITWE